MISKLKKALLISVMALGSISLTSCSSFMQAEYNSIASITTDTDENGNTIVTITFTDETMAPVVFIVPKGDKGDAGNNGVGIENITYETGEDGKTTVTISFTSDEVEDMVFDIPAPVNVTDITSVHNDELNQTDVTITLSNGEEFTYSIPDPTDGKDGLGIANVEYDDSGDSGYYTITITYTDPEVSPTEIRLPLPGKDGRGIESIVSSSDDDYWYITFNYDDGNSDTIQFDAPQSGTYWYSGSGIPDPFLNPDLENARTGDFYIDLEGLSIYRYQGIRWIFVGNIGTGVDRETCQVTFDATTNGGTISSYTSIFEVEYGKTMNATDMPIASKAGERFIGWYTSKDGPNNPNAGHFTSLTPVFSDMTVYACFEVISE